MVKGRTVVILAADDTSGVADNGAVFGNTFQNNGTCADLDVFTKGDGTQDLGACADHDTVLERRVTFAVIFARTAEGNTLINGDIVADFGGLANHNAGAVVDEEPSADGSTGMDLNAGAALGNGGDPSG